MARIKWDLPGQRKFEVGVDHGVLYLPNEDGEYDNGVAWNGLVTITEKPSGAESNRKYADNIPYLNLYSQEQFGCTIEAMTYPDQFARFDGQATPRPGIRVGQQPRRSFGLSYRTLLGDDLVNEDAGYKLHLVYGLTVSPSERANATINESLEPVNLSWEAMSIPVPAGGTRRPTSHLTVDSTDVDPELLSDFEDILYGVTGTDPVLPLPIAVFTHFSGEGTVVDPIARPAYNSGTHTLTIPAITGVTFTIGGVEQDAGDLVITEDTLLVAHADTGYVLTPGSDNDWWYDYV